MGHINIGGRNLEIPVPVADAECGHCGGGVVHAYGPTGRSRGVYCRHCRTWRPWTPIRPGRARCGDCQGTGRPTGAHLGDMAGQHCSRCLGEGLLPVAGTY